MDSINQRHVIAAAEIYRAAGIATLLKGEPGTGKSSFIKAMATNNGWHMHKELVSLKDPTDATGLPVRTEHGVEWELPRWAKEVMAASAAGTIVLVFFDEMNLAPPSTLAAYLEVILECEVLGIPLGENVYFIAAINDVSDAAGGWDLPAPMANRFGHLDWVVDASTVAAGLMGNWPASTSLHIDDTWRARRLHHAALVGGFLKSRPSLVLNVPTNEVDKGKPWPSPRTWSWVVDCLAITEACGASDTERMLCVYGLVGEGAGGELLGYLDRLDLPDPESLLAHPSSLVLPSDTNQQYAVLTSVAAAVLSNNTPKRWEASMKIMVEALRQGAADVAAVATMDLARHMPPRAKPPDGLAEFLPRFAHAELYDPSDIPVKGVM